MLNYPRPRPLHKHRRVGPPFGVADAPVVGQPVDAFVQRGQQFRVAGRYGEAAVFYRAVQRCYRKGAVRLLRRVRVADFAPGHGVNFAVPQGCQQLRFAQPSSPR